MQNDTSMGALASKRLVNLVSRAWILFVFSSYYLVIVAWTAGPVHADSRMQLYAHMRGCEREPHNIPPIPPCREVVEGTEFDGFVLLDDSDSSKLSNVLLVPTHRFSGIEDVRLASATNFFAEAAKRYQYVSMRLSEKKINCKDCLAREDVGMAVNSYDRRGQDQLHIHMDCIGPELRALASTNALIPPGEWILLSKPAALAGYYASWLPGPVLTENPFRLLQAMLPNAPGKVLTQEELGHWTLVVFPTKRDATQLGFYMLAGRYSNTAPNATGHGESLLDHRCILAQQ